MDKDGVEVVAELVLSSSIRKSIPVIFILYEESDWDYMPVVGESMRAADEFKKRRWLSRLFHSAMAISNVFMAKSPEYSGSKELKPAGKAFVALGQRETKVYRITELATGQVHKFGIGTKSLFGNYTRMEKQRRKLNENGVLYRGEYVATFSTRPPAFDFERYLVTLYRYNGPTGSRPVGNILPAINHWLW